MDTSHDDSSGGQGSSGPARRLEEQLSSMYPDGEVPDEDLPEGIRRAARAGPSRPGDSPPPSGSESPKDEAGEGFGPAEATSAIPDA